MLIRVNSTIARFNHFQSGVRFLGRRGRASCLLDGSLVSPMGFDARYNYWDGGDDSGPSTCCNPQGRGSYVWAGTDFRFWCNNASCDSFFQPTQQLNSSIFESGNSKCFAESFCTPIADRSAVALLSAESVACFIAIVANVLLFCTGRHPKELRYRRLAISVRWPFRSPLPRGSLLNSVSQTCIFLVLLSCIWVADAIVLFNQLPYSHTVLTSFVGDLRRTSLIMLCVCIVILLLYAIATIVVLSRRGANDSDDEDSRYGGASFILVTYLLGAFSFVFVMMTPQNMLPLIVLAALPFNLRSIDHLVFEYASYAFLPSNRMWLPWASATIISLVFIAFIALCLWNVIRERDLKEFENVFREVSIRSSLLGTEGTSLLRGHKTRQWARRFAFLWLIPAIFSAATFFFLSLGGGQFTLQALTRDSTFVVNLSLVASGVLSALTGFGIFYFRHYLVVLLWIQTVSSLYSSVVTSAIVANWVVIQEASTGGFSTRWEDVALNLCGIVTALLFLTGSIFTALFIRWLGPRLAGDINSSVQRRMEDIYENE